MRSLDRKIKLHDNILLIDGYNIINSWDSLKTIPSLEESRRSLLHIVGEYQSYLDQLVIVVFDSYKVKNDRQVVIDGDLVTIYTKERETADHLIEELVEIYGRRKNIRVATSDRVEQDIILARGATRISAKELEILVNGALDSIARIQESDKLKNSLHFSGLDEENNKVLKSLIEEMTDIKIDK